MDCSFEVGVSAPYATDPEIWAGEWVSSRKQKTEKSQKRKNLEIVWNPIFYSVSYTKQILPKDFLHIQNIELKLKLGLLWREL